nr:MAG TPA: hypothetical protein [Bacteriophage sp.]
MLSKSILLAPCMQRSDALSAFLADQLYPVESLYLTTRT